MIVSANYDPYLAADGSTSESVIKSQLKCVSRMDNKQTEVSMVGEEILGQEQMPRLKTSKASLMSQNQSQTYLPLISARQSDDLGSAKHSSEDI